MKNSPARGDDSPGRFGASATAEVAPRSVGRVDIAYNPAVDGDADPGEIVWTWVPYEENDGRGKDRPVLVVAREAGGTLLGLQLTSKPHDGTWDVGIGSGAWDSAGRPSWVRLERVFRLHQGGVRREAVALDRAAFGRVSAELVKRYGWATGAPAGGAARSGAAAATGGAARSGAAAATGAAVGASVLRLVRTLFGRRR
ncbi:MAG: type II toxin-antitoxin system PemK/MazF family toxin [Herbiconiux sp.]|uniref:type II toxin-antitoxin system PemK/MazF family toxin n=1 Tax=Herbiconiux sp. TaxID=1871186 RepID=UPI0012171A20|nr:type II toxin-antitoxin system PemK/MazF family toxin [Herbiconiux sp.]TAJ49506.1 MAG: type II toxin-antitoxin system PemK/MazF family toxin [Herbiconiux sp.]